MGNKIFRMGKLFSSTDIDGTIEHVGGTATQAYTKGSYFVGDDGYFYAVDENIDEGDPITLNTNCHKSSIASELANANGGIRYVEAADMVQLFYQGAWLDWQVGGMAYPIGTETTFIYNGAIQQFTVPATGYWKLECWGGKGGTVGYAGGNGGYAKGVIHLDANELLYIVVGDAGGGSSGNYTGYNGGHLVSGSGGGGGGATHIAVNNGDLLRYTLIDDVLIVAGGGGGGCGYAAGGAGGGLTGSAGGGGWHDSEVYVYAGSGGTQSSGGAGGGWRVIPAGSTVTGQTGNPGSYGQGGTPIQSWSGGGGAGYYGGGGGGFVNYGGRGASGGGGSAYVKSTMTDVSYGTNPNTQGQARLTYLGR